VSADVSNGVFGHVVATAALYREEPVGFRSYPPLALEGVYDFRYVPSRGPYAIEDIIEDVVLGDAGVNDEVCVVS